MLRDRTIKSWEAFVNSLGTEQWRRAEPQDTKDTLAATGVDVSSSRWQMDALNAPATFKFRGSLACASHCKHPQDIKPGSSEIKKEKSLRTAAQRHDVLYKWARESRKDENERVQRKKMVGRITGRVRCDEE